MKNINQWWQEGEFKGYKMYCFVSKLKMLKEKILKWNKTHFNNIIKEKLKNEEDLKNLNEEVIKKVMDFEKYNK